MKPDNSVLFAWQNVYEPLPSVDNKWIVFFKCGEDWRQKSFITKDGAYVFYYQKINEFKRIYAEQKEAQR